MKGIPSGKRVMLSAGWPAFVHNGVKKGDICLFELKSKNMMVHIIRK